MTLADLRELPLPPTRVAEGAWDRARQRRRRRTAAAVAGAVGIVAGTAVGAGLMQDSSGPAPAPQPTPSPSTAPTTESGPTIGALPDYPALAATAPTLAPTDPADLSTDPVHRAVLAIVPNGDGPERWSVVDVLGDDGRWRRVDVPGLEPTHDGGGNRWYALVPTSLSSDGTRLALPQPDRVVVVDLTTGADRSYDVPGLDKSVTWSDDDHVLVTQEGRPVGRLLDLGDGSLTPSPWGANTAFLQDGSWLTWGIDGRLTDAAGTDVTTDVANDAGAQRTAPLADADVAVGLGLSRDPQNAAQSGVAVVDRHTGRLLGFQPTMPPELDIDFSYLLGLDGGTVTFALHPADSLDLLVVRWSWRTGELRPVAVLPAEMISGTPQ